METSNTNKTPDTNRTESELEAVLNALDPSGLLYKRTDLNDLNEAQRAGLLHDVYGPGDLELRLANLHLVLPLLQKSRSKDERKFLLKVFLPWVGMRKRLSVHRNRIADEFAQTASFTAGTYDEYAHLVNIYRSIVADLIDPYLTLPLACYQFVEGSFVDLEAANYGGSERNKDEYLRSRIRNDDPQIRLLSGYSPLVRNAISHSGTHGVTYGPGTILFRNVKRGPTPTVEAAEWTENELLDNITRVYECILSIDAAVGIFGLDITDVLANDWMLLSQALHYATSPEEQAKMHAPIETLLDQIRTNNEMSIDGRLEALLSVLQDACSLRGMQLKAMQYGSAQKVLRVDVPALSLDDSADQQIRNRVMELSRYAVLAETVYGGLADTYIIRETHADGKEQVITIFNRDLLVEYNDQSAGLIDLLHEAVISVKGMVVRLTVDFEEVGKQERTSLGETFPRKGRSSS